MTQSDEEKAREILSGYRKERIPYLEKLIIAALKAKEREVLESQKELEKALRDLLDGIEYASTEVLNGKYSRGIHDEEKAYIQGAHIFFKLIGKSYPKAKEILAAFTRMKDSLK